MLPRGRTYRYPPGRNMQDVPVPGGAVGMLSAPYDMGGVPIRDAVGQPMPIQALATALANAPLEQQRTVSPVFCHCSSIVFTSHCFTSAWIMFLSYLLLFLTNGLLDAG